MKKLILSKENKQINNSIIENNKFIRNFSNCKLEMKNTLTNNDFITLNKDNKIIKMNYINKARNIIKGIQEDNKIIYPSIEEGVDLKYEVLDNKLKESIVINELQDNYQYDFELDIGDLVPTFNKENSTLELKENNKTIYRLLSPYMVDNKKDYSNDCAYEIEQNENKLNIKLTCSSEWINSPDRTLPIVIDPTIEIAKEESSLMKIYSYNKKEAFEPRDETINIGSSSVESTWYYGLKIHIYLENIVKSQKDFSSLKNVYLEMYIMGLSFSYGELEVFAYTNDKLVCSKIIDSNYNLDKPLLFDITSLFDGKTKETDLYIMTNKNQVENTIDQNSPSLISTLISNYIAVYYNNKEIDKNIKLLFSYNEKKEIKENKDEYDTYSIDNNSELNISLLKNRCTYIHKDCSISSNSLKVDVNHILLSQNLLNEKNDYCLGKGWKLNLNQKLYNEDNKIIYLDENDLKHVFKEKWYYLDENKNEVLVDKNNT